MATGVACRRTGTHACPDTQSHLDAAPWVLPGDPAEGPSHFTFPPPPSAVPLRSRAVMGYAGALRGLPTNRIYRAADAWHEPLRRRLERARDAAVAALPADERARVGGRLLLAEAMGVAGRIGEANGVLRGAYAVLGLGRAASALEEVSAGYTVALAERPAGGQLGGKRTVVYRYGSLAEGSSIARGGILRHRGGGDHLSFTLLPELYASRGVEITLGLTGNVMRRLAVLTYTSAAYIAPGRSPAFAETWRGTKAWKAGYECEVRLRTETPVSGLDMSASLAAPPGWPDRRALERLCGRKKVDMSRRPRDRDRQTYNMRAPRPHHDDGTARAGRRVSRGNGARYARGL